MFFPQPQKKSWSLFHPTRPCRCSPRIFTTFRSPWSAWSFPISHWLVEAMLLTRTDVHRAVLPNPLAPDKDPMGIFTPFLGNWWLLKLFFWEKCGGSHDETSRSSWWFQSVSIIVVKTGIFPRIENNKYLKAPPRDSFLSFLFSFVWSLLTKACTWGTSPATSTKIAVRRHDFHLSLEAKYTLNPLLLNGKQMINGAQFGIGSSGKNWIDTWLYQKGLN